MRCARSAPAARRWAPTCWPGAASTFGFEVNEFYGQTEANLIVSNCAGLFPVVPGSMGRAVPGHGVAVISPEGEILPAGQPGLIAVARPDPVMMLEYWRQPEATAAKFVGDWLVTGDTGACDEEGYFWFQGRDDDIISSRAPTGSARATSRIA